MPSVHNKLQFHVFISYNSDDIDAVRNLTYMFQNSGLRAWWDKDCGVHDQAPRSFYDVRGKPIKGDNHKIALALKSAINESMFILVVTSPRTLKSTWVREEITIAKDLNIPMFFWHITDIKDSEKVFIRHEGSNPNPSQPALEMIESVASGYEMEFLSSTASSELLNEIATQHSLNVLGHKSLPASNCGGIFKELKILIEIAELVLHKSLQLNANTVLQYWPLWQKSCNESDRLIQLIREKFRREVSIGREPTFQYFPLKEPFVLKRVKHLHRLLTDESFRKNQFTSY